MDLWVQRYFLIITNQILHKKLPLYQGKKQG